ncbi:MAG: dynamin family protein, partial [Paracoccaceae bacterium]|nr:dynamin family protein [Paracoccaceae bacterium]
MVQNAHLLSAGNAAVEGATESFAKLSKRLDQLASVTDQRTAARAAALRGRLQEFAAKVTLVGQVKAGKSALTNVLAGSPGLLPSDVNPWTSVVTTLMINTKAPADTSSTDTTKAQFTFFDKNEWSNLVIGGGRLGELAERAGASEEMQDIQKQIEAMRKATEKRLGKHFELLLGQSHSYGYVDTELMERYVCLGDDPDMGDVSAKTGRFADITKSADLYLDIPAYAMPIQLCDTPGVNDTFMMREQITIRSLRGSEICVVVLSAHQALTTTDMALMRIISTLDKRQTIIFVNRVDELSTPADQIPEIRDGIF